MVYLWIVFGTILGGGVHDFLSGMMSERNDGKSISEVVGLYMGKVITFIMRVFSVVLLVMVGVNFSVGPAGLLAKLTPDMLGTMFWLVVIMVYYLIATFLPIDKIIGKLYPVFGICLIIMALGIGGAIVLTRGSDMPELTAAAFTVVHPDSCPSVHDVRYRGLRRHLRLPRHPVAPHDPVHGKRKARPDALLRPHDRRRRPWAHLGDAWPVLLRIARSPRRGHQAGTPTLVVQEISMALLGPIGRYARHPRRGGAAHSTGDTAFRSARLLVADTLRIDQAPSASA